MAYQTLISGEVLNEHLDSPDWAIVDCRFSLTDTNQGRREYLQGHVPGAVYAHLDEDLSGKIVAGHTGRHPLPSPNALAATLAQWGVSNSTQVVAYDSTNSAFAARLWWMLRWLGHNDVAILDGGWPVWQREGHPISTVVPAPHPGSFFPRPRPELTVDADRVDEIRIDPTYCLVDSRAPERYWGETEPIDPVAGHIPGASSHFYGTNVNPDGTFLSSDDLKLKFRGKFGDTPAGRIVFYCGSGVTAAHNAFAMSLAGLGEALLYPGSWSEWIIDPGRPISRAPKD
jgi:thiosulfate/3-mercaptopyruvate sulfurtransferase